MLIKVSREKRHTIFKKDSKINSSVYDRKATNQKKTE